ncbi:putative receptor protein kinase ZmPK1 [Lotus japonicus]|uniref:putative receptor protein kinase ZmPK1 n=1 Tax=Lotus japonicus TaxID=34305 RepID=UPI00258BEEC7|nr:putative receptor protein kinase ZmPK1 [Lotus japonicus]
MEMASTIFQFPLLLFLLFLHVKHSSSFSLSVEKHQEDVIVSPNHTFTAGFYPVGENTYYFAIWFTQPPHQNLQNATVVWIANRDQPVNGKRSTLSLLKTGNVILTDAGYTTVWSTSTASLHPLELQLQETGNLVLQKQNDQNHVLWQSFDFPTNTLLPGQIFTKNTKLVSSRSETNHSSGFYNLFFDGDNLLRLLYDGPYVSSVYWPDPTLVSWEAGRSTYNSSRVAMLDHFGNFSSSDDFFLTTSDYGTVLQRRLTMDHDGNVRVYSRKDGKTEWFVSGQFHQQPCQIHGICGPNSLCSNNPIAGRKCSCLPGYSRISDEDWSQGCKPNFQFSCLSKTESRFLFLPGVDFYGYDYGFFRNYTYKQCEKLCLQLCKCTGFQYKKGDGVFKCYPKTQMLNGFTSPAFIGSIFLRLPKNINFSYENPEEDNNLVCSSNKGEQLKRLYVNGKENGSVKFMLRFASVFGGVEFMCFFLVWCFLIRKRKRFGGDTQGYVLAVATGFQRFNYSELKKATKGFSQEIGRGAGGIVYKGVLSDDRVAAIKVLHAANQGESEFLAEVSFIGRLNHMNLISMWGYCAEGKHRVLVYEYMDNGSLAENLSSNALALDWGKRYNIALGTARGLAYLHEECLEWILHCDIKPQNILLDFDYEPKVSDFGLCKLLQRNNLDNSSFSRIRGTRGYMAPEWVFNFPITSKVDVYSYGIVVLEMITGMSSMTGIQISNGVESHHERLVPWVREKRKNGTEGASWVEEIADPALETNYDMDEMEVLATVALECVAEEKDMRPSMRQVARRLQSHQRDS